MYPHRIRLRGPWECEPLSLAADCALSALPRPRRLSMPCAWNKEGMTEFAGKVRFCRSFGYPGRIDSHERVWLILEGLTQPAEVQLNSTPLSEPMQEQATV